MKRILSKISLLFSLVFLAVPSVGQTHKLALTGKVTDDAGKPVELASVILNASLGAATKRDGTFRIDGVPQGTYQYRVSFVGYQTATGTIVVKTGREQLNVKLKQLSLNLRQVTVTARQVQMGSKSQIGQEAIRHLQPKSIGDLLQLVPGNLTENPNLNKLSQAQVREIDQDKNNALGTSVVVDGTPLSNDANLQALSAPRYGTSSSGAFDGMSQQTTAGGGVDLRTVGAGNVESVEVIRGIPGVEYGNLTSGVVIVKTKAGRTPWEAKVQADPNSKLIYAGKGFRLKDGGAVNFSLDWAQSWGDTRRHYLGYDRVTAGAGYSNQWGDWSFNLKGAFYSNVNNVKRDAQMDQMETTYKNSNIGARLSANGAWKPKNAFITSVEYNFSSQFSHTIDRHHTRVSSPDGVITNVRESGIHEATFKNAAYYSDYKLDGKPFNIFAQLVAGKYIGLGDRNYTNVKLGGEYTLDDNSGRGLIYDFNDPPQRTGYSTLRPRAFRDIPAIYTLSAFASDRSKVYFGTMNLSAEAGVRLSRLFLNKDKSGGRSGMTVAEPRVNAALNLLNKKNNGLFDELSVTGGFGLSNKMPTLLYLYPDNAYFDYPSLAKYGNTGADRLALMQTAVITNTQNPHIKPTNSRKWEAGINFTIGKVKGFLTYFNEHHKHEFGFESRLYIMPCLRYNVPAGATDPAFDAATGTVTYVDGGVRQDATTTLTHQFLTWGLPSNTTRSWKHGIEYGLDLGEWKPLHTSLSINGAWFHTNRRSEVQGIATWAENNYPYAAIMPAGSGTIRDRVNTTFRFITHIPVIRMIFTTTIQAVWYDSEQGVYADNEGHSLLEPYTKNGKNYYVVRPVGVIDATGTVSPWSQTLESSILNQRMLALYETYYTKKDVVSPWAMLNFRFTKEMGKVAELSFIANNFLNTSKWHTNKYSLYKSQVYPDLYFGAELKLKF